MSRSSAAPERHPALGANAMATSSHPAVSAVGVQVLESGGNAIDAALAMAAMSWLALPGQCGVGGDAFVVVREPDGRVWTVNGSGYAPDGASTDFYRDRGFTSIPYEGALSVAGAGEMAAVATMHRNGATRSLSELWASAIRAAEQGLPCTLKTRNDIVAHAEKLRRDPGSRALLPNGRIPEVGERLPHPMLAQSMRHLAEDPLQFYYGSMAEKAIELLQAGGAPFSGDEWSADADAPVEEALSARYSSHDVYVTPQPSPGWMVLQQAAICDGWLAGLPWLDAEAIHVMASAARVSFADRFAFCGGDGTGWQDAMAPANIKSARDNIAFDRLDFDRLSGVGDPDGDTTTIVTVDRDGRAVSFVHSLAFTFGSCISIDGTGILLNNRLGRGAYLIDGHPNEVKARRRPLHTCHAWLATDSDGELSHVGNIPGGDGQVQWNMQLLSHLIDHGKDPQQAVDAPRFSVFPGSDADTLGQPEELRCESRIDPVILERLRRRGHNVAVGKAWDGGGSAQVVSVDRRHGCLLGGADSRMDGVALGV